MNEILVIEGVVNNLGVNSTNPQSITTWDSLKIRTKDGNDIFIPKNKANAKMASYITESLGQNVKIFYSVYSVGKSTEAAIFAIKFDDGRSYDKGSELDQDKAQVKKIIFMGRVCELAMLVMIVVLTISVIGIVIAFPLAYALWKMHGGLKMMSNIIEVFPSTKSFKEFYDNYNNQNNSQARYG